MGSEAAKRPRTLSGPTYKTTMPNCGSIFTIVNLPLEVLVKMGKAGGCQNSWIEAVGRLISLGLRYGVPVEDIVKELKGIRCGGAGSPKGGPGMAVLSCPDAIARDIGKAIEPEPEILDEGSTALVYRDNQSDSIA